MTLSRIYNLTLFYHDYKAYALMWEDLRRQGRQVIHGPFLNLRQKICDELHASLRASIDLPDLACFHEKVHKNEVNQIRLDLFQALNNQGKLRNIVLNELHKQIVSLVGKEFAIQKNINLSIVPPGDTSSILPLHSDVYAGNSPYEVVFWIPLLKHFQGEQFFTFCSERSRKIQRDFNLTRFSQEEIFQRHKEFAEFVNLKEDEVFVFSSSIFHGSRINETKYTRWSINFRVKGLFTPYGQKGLSDFFVHEGSLHPGSALGLGYEKEES